MKSLYVSARFRVGSGMMEQIEAEEKRLEQMMLERIEEDLETPERLLLSGSEFYKRIWVDGDRVNILVEHIGPDRIYKDCVKKH